MTGAGPLHESLTAFQTLNRLFISELSVFPLPRLVVQADSLTPARSPFASWCRGDAEWKVMSGSCGVLSESRPGLKLSRSSPSPSFFLPLPLLPPLLLQHIMLLCLHSELDLRLVQT